MLISVFAHLIYLQPWMALVALALFVPQCCFVPMVQRVSNRRTESRIQVLHRLSADIVAESAEGVLERESRSYRCRVSDIYSLNIQIYRIRYLTNTSILALNRWPSAHMPRFNPACYAATGTPMQRQTWLPRRWFSCL